MEPQHRRSDQPVLILAKDVGVDAPLERLFRRLSEPVAETLLHGITPAKGAQPLMQTDMSVINVALACGFASPSHFKVLSCVRHTNSSRERGAPMPRAVGLIVKLRVVGTTFV
jgi:transcriptional regulator GlxA family with amidase domain